jgi:hypothetical protein
MNVMKINCVGSKHVREVSIFDTLFVQSLCVFQTVYVARMSLSILGPCQLLRQ